MAQVQRIIHVPRLSSLIQYVKNGLHAPEIDVDVIREVLAYYRLDLVGPPRNLTVGKRNRNLVVKTDRGQKVLKRYWPGWGTPVIAYEHSILNRLAEVGFAAPRLVATPEGRTIVNWQGENYALFGFQGGGNYAGHRLLRSHRLRLMALAGLNLARLHRQLEGFVPLGRHHSGFRSPTGDRWRDLAWHVDKVNDLQERSRHLADPEAATHAAWLIRNSGYILRELGSLDQALRVAPLPRLLIHGDYGFHNLHFHDDGTVTTLDFESARLEWRVRDLVTCLPRFRFADGSFDVESIRMLASAYQNEYPLTTEERRLLPQVWRFCKLQDAVKYWNSYFETGGPTRKLVSARDAVRQADWALEHPSDIAALIEKP